MRYFFNNSSLFYFLELEKVEKTSSIVAVEEKDSEEDEVKPMEDDAVNQIRKNMEKMKMNRDLEHIQVTFNNYQ